MPESCIKALVNFFFGLTKALTFGTINSFSGNMNNARKQMWYGWLNSQVVKWFNMDAPYAMDKWFKPAVNVIITTMPSTVTQRS